MLQPTSVNPKGQVTIPVSIRKILGIKPGNRIHFNIDKVSKKLTLERVMDIDELMGYFKSPKKYNEKKAESAYVKDIVNNFLDKRKREQ